jgi:probable HAF family extracellular repeat protein
MIITLGRVRGFILAAAFLAGLGFGTSAYAQAVVRSYLVDLNSKAVTDVGDLGSSIERTRAFGINDAGQVVGSAPAPEFPAPHAFITGPNGMGIRDLGCSFPCVFDGGSSQAFGVNDVGQVVGGFSTIYPVPRAFIIDPGIGVRSLGTLGGVGAGTTALGINEAGQVVGSSATAGGAQHAFITGPDGIGMRDLGTLGGTTSSRAYGINDAGQVVGSSYSANTPGGSPIHAFITGPNGMGMRDVGTLGALKAFSFASGINDTGQVVGTSATAGGGTHAFITGPNGMGMRDLGTLGGADSTATGINDAGQVVGWSQTAGGAYHAFITGPNGAEMMDLNSVVDLPAGLILTNATAINNAGQVVAFIPEPEVYALFLAGLALVGFMTWRKRLPV